MIGNFAFRQICGKHVREQLHPLAGQAAVCRWQHHRLLVSGLIGHAIQVEQRAVEGVSQREPPVPLNQRGDLSMGHLLSLILLDEVLHFVLRLVAQCLAGILDVVAAGRIVGYAEYYLILDCRLDEAALE